MNIFSEFRPKKLEALLAFWIPLDLFYSTIS